MPCQIGKSKVLLIDTPGFDDTHRTDSEILEEISRILTAQYELGIQLKGVFYLHRVSDVRFSGSSMKTLKIFTQICGAAALESVTLVTTRWDQVDESTGALRERELRDNFWAYMVSQGSKMTRFHGDRDSAVSLVSGLLGNPSIVLAIQRELVEEGKTLSQTSAGAIVNDNLTEMKQQYQQQLAELEEARRTLAADDATLRRKMEQDYEREVARLRRASEDEEIMRRRVAAEVRQEIQVGQQKNSSIWSGLGKTAMHFLPTALSILGMFVGFPTGVTGLFTNWFADSGLEDTLDNIFSSF